MMLQKICGWCSKYLGTIPSKEEGITHSICEDCYKKYKEQIKKGEVKVEN